MKYSVSVWYEGALNFTIEAEDEDEAIEIAEEKFNKISADELANYIMNSTFDCCEL